MRRHGDQRAHGDNAGAADAGHQQVKGLVEPGQFGHRQLRRQARHVQPGPRAFAAAAALDGDERGAEPVETGVILVTGRLVDLPFGAELSLLRLDA